MLLPGLPGEPVQVDVAGGETLGKSTRCGSCFEGPGDSSGLQTMLPLVTGCLAAEERYARSDVWRASEPLDFNCGAVKLRSEPLWSRAEDRMSVKTDAW